MQFAVPTAENPFAILTFLAAPAILTNACALLVMSTSNRLARAADRARAASAAILSARTAADTDAEFHRRQFQNASRRAHMLVESLRLFYLAGGCFSAGTCIALVGAFGSLAASTSLIAVTMVLTATGAVIGVTALVLGCLKLVAETRLALQSLDEQHAAITAWRATHTPGDSIANL